jgi:Na+/H+-translocating membrane pyrophosphatase
MGGEGWHTLTYKVVGRSAQEVVKEVRRQFHEKPGIMTYQVLPCTYMQVLFLEA